MTNGLMAVIVAGRPYFPGLNPDDVGQDALHVRPLPTQHITRCGGVIAFFLGYAGKGITFLPQGGFDVPGVPVCFGLLGSGAHDFLLLVSLVLAFFRRQ